MIVNILKSDARVCNATSVVPLPPGLTVPERSSVTQAAATPNNPTERERQEHVQKYKTHGSGGGGER